MFCVGVTGNISSGKSTAVRCFKQLGIPVICADTIARQLTAGSTPSLQRICAYFGDHILHQSGELNRALLKKIIVADSTHRIWLENLLHPLIREEIARQVNGLNSFYCVIEIPLLTHREHYPYLNRILLILADSQKQIERVMKRDHLSYDEAKAILDIQPNEINRRELADDIIMNDGTIQQFIENIHAIHELYLSMAGTFDLSHNK